MHAFEIAQGGQQPTHLQSIKALADLVASTSPDMRVPEIEQDQRLARPLIGTGNQTTGNKVRTELSALDREAQKDAGLLSKDKLIQKYGHAIANRAIEAVKLQAPNAPQAFSKYQRQEREAKRELGRALAAAGVEVQRHSVQDYTHVIVTQLNLFQVGATPSVSAVVDAAFPDDPKKATSIKNSQHCKRRKQAYDSPAVINHPIEKAMQLTHGKNSMNQRDGARTFGQSLSMNAALYKSCERIIKQDAQIDQLKQEVHLLQQQMQATKNREALADAGCNTSREKVLALYDQGKRQTEIATLLGMSTNTVKSILRRSKKN